MLKCCTRLSIVLALIVVPVLFVLSSPNARPEPVRPEPVRPTLAVLVYFDQLRGDYPKRWDELYGRDGFQRLEEDGAWFQNCHYAYANTVTGAGHASVATGTYPQTHGIIANEWFDRASQAKVNCVESQRYERVPPAKKSTESETKKKEYTGVAPDRLLAPTLGDAFKKATGGRARVVSLSFKDRGAVLPGGQHPDACYWFDSDDGLFVTSTYYRDSPHSWVAKYNADHPADRWFGKEWTRLRPGLDYERYSGLDDAPGEGKGANQGTTFPHPFDGGPKKLKSVYYKQLYNSPFGNEMLLELAKRAIDGEALGHHNVPDLLCLSFSCNDPIGHVWGPDSQEVLDVTLRTDRIIQGLLDALDAKVGPGKYVLAITADHGVCPLPEAARARGEDAGRIPESLAKVKANKYLVETFGGDERTRYIEAFDHPWFWLNQKLLQSKGLTSSDVEAALAGWLVKQPGIAKAYTRTQLIAGVAKDDEIGQTVQRSFHPERSGDVGMVQKPYYILYGLTGTTHGSPNPYDTHVPLFVYGPGIKAEARTDLVRPQAAVSILARALDVAPPDRAEEAVPSGLFEK